MLSIKTTFGTFSHSALSNPSVNCPHATPFPWRPAPGENPLTFQVKQSGICEQSLNQVGETHLLLSLAPRQDNTDKVYFRKLAVALEKGKNKSAGARNNPHFVTFGRGQVQRPDHAPSPSARGRLVRKRRSRLLFLSRACVTRGFPSLRALA